jgi:hypothetical protein
LHQGNQVEAQCVESLVDVCSHPRALSVVSVDTPASTGAERHDRGEIESGHASDVANSPAVKRSHVEKDGEG